MGKYVHIMNKSPYLLIGFLCCFLGFANAQDAIKILPVYSPKEIHLKVFAKEKCISQTENLLREHSLVKIEVLTPFNFESELILKGFKVDLVRRGQLISWQKVEGNEVDLTDLLEIAEEGDIFNFLLDEIQIIDGEERRAYSQGKMAFQKVFSRSAETFTKK